MYDNVVYCTVLQPNVSRVSIVSCNVMIVVPYYK